MQVAPVQTFREIQHYKNEKQTLHPYRGKDVFIIRIKLYKDVLIIRIKLYKDVDAVTMGIDQAQHL